MIIWGWGMVTRSGKGSVFQKQCEYCNQMRIWQLCVKRTWFTVFFIPIIPYEVQYCIECPNCGSYIKITKEKYKEILSAIQEKKHLNKQEKDVK